MKEKPMGMFLVKVFTEGKKVVSQAFFSAKRFDQTFQKFERKVVGKAFFLKERFAFKVSKLLSISPSQSQGRLSLHQNSQVQSGLALVLSLVLLCVVLFLSAGKAPIL